MTKRYLMSATVTMEMIGAVEVPDDWTEEDVENYYKSNGADNEEFIEWPSSRFWDWGCAFSDSEEFNFPTLLLTDEDKVN